VLCTSASAYGASGSEPNVAGKAAPTRGVLTERVKTRPNIKAFDTLYGSPFLDHVVSGISGWPLTTTLENDPAEWYGLFGIDDSVLGFVCITDTDPSDWCYHSVLIGPTATFTFMNWFNDVSPTYWDAAIAIMTVTHESNHYKLMSADGGRVNACALQQFPSVIDTYFGIRPTITKTVAVHKVVWRWKWVWTHRHGKRVKVKKRVSQVITTYVQQTFQNPDYVNLVAAANLFYQSQPPAYNTGTCY
jgi:hypothetical protein